VYIGTQLHHILYYDLDDNDFDKIKINRNWVPDNFSNYFILYSFTSRFSINVELLKKLKKLKRLLSRSITRLYFEISVYIYYKYTCITQIHTRARTAHTHTHTHTHNFFVSQILYFNWMPRINVTVIVRYQRVQITRTNSWLLRSTRFTIYGIFAFLVFEDNACRSCIRLRSAPLYAARSRH